MHGMLFTKIELDNFDGAFDRFMERLTEDLHMGTVSGTTRPIPQVEWLTMAIVNIAAMMQYGIDDGLLRKALAGETVARKVQKAAQASQAPHALIVRDEDGSPDDHVADALAGKIKTLRMDISQDGTLPLPLANACRLSFAMLRFCLQHPVRLIGLTNVLNPYISTMLTFLATAVKQLAALQVLEYYIPWTELVAFFNAIPQKMEIRPDPSAKLMGGPPIPEDWCMRGMEWVGRRVYERGFWKVKGNSTGSSRGSGGPAQPRQGPRVQNEMDVLTELDTSPDDAINGVVDDVEGSDVTDTPPAITQRRWKRAAWAAGIFLGCVPGLQISAAGQVEIVPDGPLQAKILAWEAERQRKIQEEMERLRREEEARGEWALEEGQAMLDDAAESDSEEDGDEPELADLRARRRHLRSLLRQPVPAIYPPRSARASSRKSQPAQTPFLPGYTVLVFDTNVLLSSLELFESVTESKLWTCVVPLPGKSILRDLVFPPLTRRISSCRP
jgi:protein SMG6